MGINRLTGVGWHVTTLRKDEKDDRRHKSRCTYYHSDGYCEYRCSKCVGSAHCSRYKEITSQPSSVISSDDNNCNVINKLRWKVGAYVHHSYYGHGHIVSIDDSRIQVKFVQSAPKRSGKKKRNKTTELIVEFDIERAKEGTLTLC